MSQVTGAFTVELDLDRLAGLVADKVLSRLQAAARDATGEPWPGGPVGSRQDAAGDWEVDR